MRAERVVRAALRGGGRLTRAELFAVLDGGGVATQGQRGYHVLTSLSLRRVVVQGPGLGRDDGAPVREQHIVLFDEWIADAAPPADPTAELFARYIAGHGPATAADFAWWAGLPIGAARGAAEAAADAVQQVPGDGEPCFVSASAPRRRADAPRVIALPPFDEYYLSYADRSGVCDAGLLDRVGPGKNGMVAAVLVADGEVVGRWTHSVAVGRHREGPAGELFASAAAAPDELDAAFARYRAFIAA